ncbi:hypothetical protein Tcan_15555 [Toxocara canis]|uniref:Uncharacterized protein n=1 Tax=Toxocara canis TaxID=6265 RepID=A0A0B2VU20_TOXCA|nr:hypothetical protein Tcan_15555 [Toxocara canis]
MPFDLVGDRLHFFGPVSESINGTAVNPIKSLREDIRKLEIVICLSTAAIILIIVLDFILFLHRIEFLPLSIWDISIDKKEDNENLASKLSSPDDQMRTNNVKVNVEESSSTSDTSTTSSSTESRSVSSSDPTSPESLSSLINTLSYGSLAQNQSKCLPTRQNEEIYDPCFWLLAHSTNEQTRITRVSINSSEVPFTANRSAIDSDHICDSALSTAIRTTTSESQSYPSDSSERCTRSSSRSSHLSL